MPAGLAAARVKMRDYFSGGGDSKSKTSKKKEKPEKRSYFKTNKKIQDIDVPPRKDVMTSEEMQEPDLPDSGRASPTRVMHFVHVMVVVCLHYLAVCLKRLSDLLRLQAELNRRAVVAKTTHESCETSSESDFKTPEKNLALDQSFDSGYGTLRKDELKALRIRPKFTEVTSLSPEKMRWRASQASTPSDPLSLSMSETLSIPITTDLMDEEQTLELLWGSVGETRIITTVFEVQGAGLGSLLEDLQTEIGMWFEEKGLLVVCSELVWSVPYSKKDAGAETRMKQDLFKALRGNNKAVLDMQFPEKKTNEPVILPESATEEVSGREKQLQAYQGVYRRYYSGLMPHRHREATAEHAPYWEFDRSVLKPQPEKFLLGSGRNVHELSKNALIALNLIVLKFDK